MNKYFVIGLVFGFFMGLLTISLENIESIKFYVDEGIAFLFGGL